MIFALGDLFVKYVFGNMDEVNNRMKLAFFKHGNFKEKISSEIVIASSYLRTISNHNIIPVTSLEKYQEHLPVRKVSLTKM